MSARVEKGKRWFKFVLLMVGITAGIKALFALGHPSMGNKLAEAFVQFIGGTIIFGGPAFALGWFAGKEDISKDGGTSPDASTSGLSPTATSSRAQISAQENSFDEDAAYSKALTELESGAVEQAIWSRAFADAEGVDTKARARYITLRVERMRKAT
jgi:hypothetical protein